MLDPPPTRVHSGGPPNPLVDLQPPHDEDGNAPPWSPARVNQIVWQTAFWEALDIANRRLSHEPAVHTDARRGPLIKVRCDAQEFCNVVNARLDARMLSLARQCRRSHDRAPACSRVTISVEGPYMEILVYRDGDGSFYRVHRLTPFAIATTP